MLIFSGTMADFSQSTIFPGRRETGYKNWFIKNTRLSEELFWANPNLFFELPKWLLLCNSSLFPGKSEIREVDGRHGASRVDMGTERQCAISIPVSWAHPPILEPVTRVVPQARLRCLVVARSFDSRTAYRIWLLIDVLYNDTSPTALVL
jgi:hypothetical protein